MNCAGCGQPMGADGPAIFDADPALAWHNPDCLSVWADRDQPPGPTDEELLSLLGI